MKVVEAIVNTRVSTAEQLQSNSLSRQQEKVERAADRLGAVIPADGRWSGSVSSKAGTNVKRKDLLEMLEYCKVHKNVKYAIFDEYDRFMRSVNEGPYFEVLFQQLGVKVWYASETDAFNGDDAMAKFMRSMSAYRAEGSNEERQRKSISGHEKAIRDGRYTFQTKPGYIKGVEPGIHLPHPITFKPLQTAFREVLSGLYTPLEALKRLNDTKFTEVHAPWSMDKFRHFATDPYYAGILEMDVQVKARNEHGLHHPMLSRDEHQGLITIFTGTLKPRGPKKQYNPEFPMNKIMMCEDCGGQIKFTGSKKSNGYARKTTHYYFKYHCRGCGKSYHRDEVHSLITERFQQVQYTGQQRDEFVEALQKVWGQKKQDRLQELNSLRKNIETLQSTKSRLVLEMVKSDEKYKADIELELDKVKANIIELEARLDQSQDLGEDLVGFVKFGLEYSNELMNDWWELNHDERVRCQQLIFPGGITFNAQKKVGTPNLSPFYRLEPNKKDLSFAEKSLMVELAGTAPASAGLLS